MAMEKSRGENLPVNITAAPFAAVPMTRKEEKSIRVSFMGQPVLRPGQARQCVLSVENHTAEKLEGPVECKVSGCAGQDGRSYHGGCRGDRPRALYRLDA